MRQDVHQLLRGNHRIAPQDRPCRADDLFEVFIDPCLELWRVHPLVDRLAGDTGGLGGLFDGRTLRNSKRRLLPLWRP